VNDAVELPSRLSDVQLVISSGQSLLVLFNKRHDDNQNSVIITRFRGNVTLLPIQLCCSPFAWQYCYTILYVFWRGVDGTTGYVSLTRIGGGVVPIFWFKSHARKSVEICSLFDKNECRPTKFAFRQGSLPDPAEDPRPKSRPWRYSFFCPIWAQFFINFLSCVC